MTNEKSLCTRCSGLGKIKCPACRGAGKFEKLNEDHKQEKKIVSCAGCNGSGVMTCGSCGGSGKK